jgi:membrane dipeptidase
MDSAADLPKITEGLLKRGYTAAQIRKILGGNFMRVFRQVEQVSKQMRAQKSQQLRSAARQMSSAH